MSPSCTLGVGPAVMSSLFGHVINPLKINQACSMKMAEYSSFFFRFNWPISSKLDLKLGQERIFPAGTMSGFTIKTCRGRQCPNSLEQ